MRLHSREEWAKIRTLGPRRYLLRYGVVARGIPMGVVVALLIEFINPSGAMPESLLGPRFLWMLLLAVAVFSASGCISAWANWRVHERRFLQQG
jgi:hypothetical protein